MHACLLVLDIEPLEVGRVYAMLPLHCTLVHWFRLDTPVAELLEHLEQVAGHTPPLAITAGAEDVFTGTTKQGTIPVAVNHINRTPALQVFHMEVCKILDALHAQYVMPQYVKAGFNPHVTHQHGSKLATGTTHLSTALYVVEAEAPEYGNDRQVTAKINLAG